MDNKLKELIAEYLSGELSEKQQKELDVLVGKTGTDLDALLDIYKNLAGFDVPEPSNKMDDAFYTMLRKEKLTLSNKISYFSYLKTKIQELFEMPAVPRLAYGFILFLLGLIIGNILLPNRGYENQISSMSLEMKEIRKVMILALIEKPQAVDRIKAVSYVNEMSQADQKVIDALFKTLNNDTNINVRLAGLDALKKYIDNPQIRKRLINSFQFQDSPIVLIELAELMINLQEKKSIDELQKLLNDEELDPNLRLTIENGIQVLT
ncbi:MAG: hypothetical protein B6I20_07715 [Bacteroidetes bacterium 4572_117]|nr:MAG: hypothetical protein B6I20_07715 [Bacteroidetes bacterium 4572_117]